MKEVLSCTHLLLSNTFNALVFEFHAFSVPKITVSVLS